MASKHSIERDPFTSVSRFAQFLTTDIWRIRSRDLSGKQFFWLRQLRILVLAVRGFAEDRCQLRASALTFYSLISIVPILAMAFGIAKGFGLEKIFEAQVTEKLQGQGEAVERIISFARTLLENTKGGVVAGVGVAILFWTVIKVLGTIENSFNDIWGIKRPRSLGRKFSDYLSVMLVCPLLLIIASSITVLIASQVTLLVEKFSFLGPLGDAILFALKIAPYGVIWIVFTFIYVFMPNTKVRFQSGLVAGIIAGTIYQLVQLVYIKFQIGVSHYGAIYGSFAALPLFLIWVQVSWLVVLFGAEVSFAQQNVETYEFEPDCSKVSSSFAKLASLAITHLCVKSFLQALRPPSPEEISKELDIPIRLVHRVLFELTEARILSQVGLDGLERTGYQPAYHIEHLTVARVLKALDNQGIDSIPIVESDTLNKLRQSLEQICQTIEQSPSNLSLKDL